MAVDRAVQKNEDGGIRGFGVIKATVEMIVDEPTVAYKTPYTIFTPVASFGGVVMRRQFTRGRAVVYDPEIAREFVSTYGYRCEPDLPTPAKRKHRRRMMPADIPD